MAQDTTTTGFDAVLKNIYEGPIRDQLNKRTNLLDFFTKDDVSQRQWEGKAVIIPLRKSRNYGVKAMGESGLIPTAGKQGYANLTVPIRKVMGHIELTSDVMEQSKSDKGSFARALESEQKGLIEDLARQRNRMLGYYGSGILATIPTGANNAAQTVSAPGGVTGSVNVTRFLQPGMVVNVSNADGSVLRGTYTITAVNASTGVVTFDSACNSTNADIITLGSNIGGGNEGSYGLEPMGLLGIADTSTYVASFMGLDRSQAANAFFACNVMSNVGALTPDYLQRAIDNAEEVSGELIDGFVCHQSVRREFLKLTEADRRYAGGSSAINSDAGTQVSEKDITFANKPVKTDKDFAYGSVVGYNKSHLYRSVLTEGEWADDDGTVLLRNSSKDVYEARYRIRDNFWTDKGSAHLRMDGISATVSSGVFSI